MTYECVQNGCDGLVVLNADGIYQCDKCGTKYRNSDKVDNKKEDKSNIEIKVLFFNLVEHSINKLFGFYLMVLFLLSCLVYTVEYASGTHLAWWYVVVQILINGAFFYSAYKLGEEKIK